MAKYLGGIKDQNIEVTGISQHFFDNGFDVEYYDYNRDTIAVVNCKCKLNTNLIKKHYQ